MAIYLDDVPDATREWKPDSEPKARMREIAGQRGVPLPQINSEAQAERSGISIHRKVKKSAELLADEAPTAFFFVTLPEILPIAVITSFINWFHELGIPIGGVIVNGVIQKDQVAANTVEFVRNRVQMQDEHMAEIWQIFGDRVRAIAPLFETEVKGAKMLNRLTEHLFAA